MAGKDKRRRERKEVSFEKWLIISWLVLEKVEQRMFAFFTSSGHVMLLPHFLISNRCSHFLSCPCFLAREGQLRANHDRERLCLRDNNCIQQYSMYMLT